MKALITRKVGMTSIVHEDGRLIPVTLLSASPCIVMDIKNIDKNGYLAVALGFETAKHPAKPQIGQYKNAGITPKIVREFRTKEIESEISVGAEIAADVFSVGDQVCVSAVSKGKGFAGTIKRHNFARGRKTHGNQNYRRPGSIGSQYPQKIMKGKRMAGRMGAENVTVRNLEVALVDMEFKIIGVIGAVPGPRKGIVTIKGVGL